MSTYKYNIIVLKMLNAKNWILLHPVFNSDILDVFNTTSSVSNTDVAQVISACLCTLASVPPVKRALKYFKDMVYIHFVSNVIDLIDRYSIEY